MGFSGRGLRDGRWESRGGRRHKMHDVELISTETIIKIRERPRIVRDSKRMKDASEKAVLTRKRRAAPSKAVEMRYRRLLSA